MKFFKRAAALLTVAVMCINATVFSYAQSYNTINITSSQSKQVTYGGELSFTYLKGTYTKGENSYNEKAYTFSLKQDANTYIDVTSGNTLYGRKTLSALTSQYKAPAGYRVVAAVNGDFFASGTGLALGLEVSGGVLKSSNNYNYEKSNGRYTLGFKADGTAVVGVPNLTINVTVGEVVVSLDRVNAYPQYNFVLLTDDYGDKTYWDTALKHDVIVLEGYDDIGIGKHTGFKFVSYHTGITEPLKIEQNHFYLIAVSNDEQGRINKLMKAINSKMPSKLPETELVTDPTSDIESTLETASETTPEITPESNPTVIEGAVSVRDNTGGWSDVVTAIGGGNLLINNGQMRYPETYDSSISKTMTSRTAVGIKPDGSVVFYVVERYKSGNNIISAGVPIEAVTQALYNMGCVHAINFDGGGSTTISAAEKGGNCIVRNSPQDGSERRVANSFVIVSKDTAPAVVEEFDTELVTVPYFEGANLLKVSPDTQNYHMGTGSLKAEYTLSGVESTVGFDFKTPYDVIPYNNITVWLGAGSQNIGISAVLEVNGKYVHRKITQLNFDGFKRFTIDVSDAQKLIGFEFNYELASNNQGAVFIDRIVGYSNNISNDTEAPALSVNITGGNISASAVDTEYPALNSYVDYQFTVDGVITPYTKNETGVSFDTTAITGNRVVKTVIDAYDIVGNRSRQIMLFKTTDHIQPLPYADMTEGKWDELYIRYCTQTGIINGFSENGVSLFKGSDSVTRAQFCAMLVRKQGLDVNLYADVVLPYEDISTIPAWALPYIKAAYAEGIMTGSGTFTGIAFYASNNITRQEAACAIDRINQKDTRLNKSVNYNDNTDIANWAKEAVQSLSKQGILGGDSDGKFYPLRTLSRSEAATIMTRI